MEPSGTDQLEYYLSSLNELGGVLIDADRVDSVGSGILRLTLGTVLAWKGAIFLYNKDKEISLLSKRGFDLSDPISPPQKTIETLKQHSHGHVVLPKGVKGITGALKKYLLNEKAQILLPLFHKDTFLGLLCVGPKFMNESYSTIDKRILEIIASHLTKALYNYQL